LEELANSHLFIVITGSASLLGFILGFFTCKKVKNSIKTDNSKSMKKNSQNIGNNSNNNSQSGIS